MLMGNVFMNISQNDSVGKSQCTGTWDKIVMWASAKGVKHCAKGENQQGKYVYF